MARCMGALSGSHVPQAFSGWSAFMAARITHCMLSSHVYGPFDPRDVEAAFVDPRPTGTARPDSAGTTALFRRELLGSYVAVGVTLLAIRGFVVEGVARLTSLAGAAQPRGGGETPDAAHPAARARGPVRRAVRPDRAGTGRMHRATGQRIGRPAAGGGTVGGRAT